MPKQIFPHHFLRLFCSDNTRTQGPPLKGAESRVPNLVTQISEVEMQVRPGLTWQHHDWCIHKAASADPEFDKQFFAE